MLLLCFKACLIVLVCCFCLCVCLTNVLFNSVACLDDVYIVVMLNALLFTCVWLFYVSRLLVGCLLYVVFMVYCCL